MTPSPAPVPAAVDDACAPLRPPLAGQASQAACWGELSLDNMSSGLVVLDQNLNLCFLNAAAEDIFEVSNRVAEGRYINSVLPVGDSVLACMVSTLREERVYVERGMEFKLGSGSRVVIDCSITPIVDNPDFRGVLIELQRVDRHLRISREEGMLNNEAVTRNVLRGLAHEIKNPLGGIRGSAQLLERELPSEDLRDFTRIIMEEADRLQGLLDRMLGPRVPPSKHALNIHEVLERVRALLNAEISGDERAIRIIPDYDPSIPDLYADADMMIQALLNVSRNAVQALNESVSTEDPRLILRTRIQRQFTVGQRFYRQVCRIEIVDNGPGIPGKLEKTLFFPMVTGRSEGTGLGLSIAQTLINQHKGLIEFHSEPGETIFSIYLPLDTSHEGKQ